MHVRIHICFYVGIWKLQSTQENLDSIPEESPDKKVSNDVVSTGHLDVSHVISMSFGQCRIEELNGY